MQYIQPTWPAPKNIKAYTTTRQEGTSLDPYSSFNLADHVGDAALHVANNRSLLAQSLNLPSTPIWLQQVHSNVAINLENTDTQNPVADAAVTSRPNIVCAILTADCLPILICNKKGTKVGAIHAGWRGLANGIIDNTLNALDEDPTELLAWMGPAIGPEIYEVSQDVLQSFITEDQEAISAFKPKANTENKWLANLYLLATMRLNSLGLTAVYGGEYCTFLDQQKFYSYRRDRGITGRMATLIWLCA